MKQDLPVNEFRNRFVKEEDFKEIVGKINLLTTGIIIVLFIGFVAAILAVIGPIIEVNKFKIQTYQSLVDKVTDQNVKIDLFYQQCVNQKTFQNISKYH